MVVGGDTADNVDFIDAMNAWLPFVFAFVLGLSFILLTIVFRSIVIAGTSIVLNLLSVGAAYGLVVLVFRHGIGSGLLGFQRVNAIEAWVPLFLFSVLFGLSMDYQVFLLSRIKERYDATGSTTDAVDPRRLLDRAADHRRGADHRRRLQRLRAGRPRHVPADGLRHRRRAADRRDDHPLGAPAGAMVSLGDWNWYLRTGSSGYRTSRSRPRSARSMSAPPEPGELSGHAHHHDRSCSRVDSVAAVR